MASSSGDNALPANRDSSGAEQTQNQLVVKPSQEEFDYELWREGNRTTHVKCCSNTGKPSYEVSAIRRHWIRCSDADLSAHNESSGMYTQYIKLESQFPFQVLHTNTLTEGTLAGCQAIIVKPELPFPFLKLPRELRDEIYTHAMVQGILPSEFMRKNCSNDGMIRFSYISSPRDTPHYTHLKPLESNSTSNKNLKEYIKQRQSLTPSLLVTSHQIYRETLPILYGSNEFVMTADTVLPAMITQFGNYGNHLRRLHLTRFWEASSVGKYVEPLVHLQSITVDCSSYHFDEAQDIALIAGVFFDKTYRWIRRVASAHKDETYAANLVVINCNSDCPFERKTGVWQNWRRCVMADAFQCELKKIILARSSVSLPLFKLPRKVRDLVYQHAMVYTPPATAQLDDDAINIDSDEEGGPLRTIWDCYADTFANVKVCDGFLWSESLTPGLLRVNRQIYQESVQILYGKNNFDLEGPEAAKEWLDRIGYSHVYLRDVSIGFLPVDRTIFYKLLHVDRLSFSGFSSYYFDRKTSRSPEERAKVFFALAGHWIEGAGSFRGGRAAAIDRIHPYAPVSEDEEEHWVSRFRAELKKICG